MTVKESFRNLQPFKCDSFEEIRSSIKEFHDPKRWERVEWLIEKVDRIAMCKNLRGSWNILLYHVEDYLPNTYYKVFRIPYQLGFPQLYGEPSKQIEYEYHPDFMPCNQWIIAEISESPRLTGVKGTGCPPKFHLLYNKTQAEFYLESCKDHTTFYNCTPYISKVKAQKFFTMDLIYVPPISFMWGIDAEEIYVEKD